MTKNGQLKKAIEICQSAIQADPQNPDFHVRLGDLYLERHLDIYQTSQCIDEAITEYQCALEAYLDSPEIHCKIGKAHYHKGDFDKSLSNLNQAIKYDETYSEAYLLIAKTLYKKCNYLEAIPYVEKAIKYSGLKSSRAHHLHSELYLSLAHKNLKTFIKVNWEFVLAVFTLPFDKEAIKIIVQKIEFLKFIKVVFKGFWLEKTKKIYQAIDFYNEAIEKAPGFGPLYVILGDAYKMTAQYDEAINEYKMALWLDSTNIIALKSLCSVYEEQGDYDNAIKCYEKLIELNPSNAVFYSNLANIYYLKGQIPDAISCYQTAITLNPQRNWTSIIAQTLGFVFQEQEKDYDAAISAYQSASILNPTDIDIYINLGSVFYDKGDFANALHVYRTALEIAPNNARIHCNLGFLLWGKGIIDESIKEYETAIKLDPTYDIAFNNLAVIYLDDLGHVQKSIELFDEAIKHNPNYALAYYNKGRAVAIKGDNVEAARLYQVALDINTITCEMDSNEIKDRINNLFS